jgi:GT2 family glycosyltransferase
MTLRSRIRAAVRGPLPLTGAQRWAAYLAGVEPGVAAAPRVHRFAAVPMVGEPDTAAAPVAVWIDAETSGADGAALIRTRAALEESTVAPVAVLEGPLPAALAATSTERVMLVRAGDEPAPLALERLGQAATLAPDAAVITCDEDRLAAGRSRREPHFRPGPSPDRWLACDDSGALLVVDRERASAALAAGGSAAWGHGLALALAGVASEHHAHVPMPLCHLGDAPAAADDDAVARVLAGWDPAARVERAGEVRRIRRPLRSEPLVEVIVCLRDKPRLLERCAGSLLARTAYERLILALVDNGSVEPDTATLLDRLARDDRVSVLRDERMFNFAALNNLAAASSAADVLVFLNNDTEIIDGDWVQTLLQEALRPEVGAVAPLLRYPDGTVQHAGAALGLHGYAGHPFAGLEPEKRTPFGFASQGTRNWLAVTAACLMLERWKFDAVGGFDETFIVAGNDVDLCLRLTAAGHRSLCVPHVVVVHDESRSRGGHIDPRDFVTSERSYGAFRTVGDPFYNPNLTLDATDCAVRVPAKAGP